MPQFGALGGPMPQLAAARPIPPWIPRDEAAMTPPAFPFTLRPATIDDREYLYRLNETTMRAYAEQTYGLWDETVARRIFDERFRPASIQIVVVDGHDAGMLEVVITDTRVILANIRVAPEYQGQGIGTCLISEVLCDAHGRGLPVILRVLRVNPARRLYERLGFVVIGETGPHYLMAARPPTSGTAKTGSHSPLS
jgi:ribosomal protein S18 acetylase RimI-like enzyme